MAHSVYWYVVLGVDILFALILLVLLVLLIIQLLSKPPPSRDEEKSLQTASLQLSMQKTQPETLVIDLTQRSELHSLQLPTAIEKQPSSKDSEEEIEILPGDIPMDPKEDWIDFEPKTLRFAGGITAMQKIGMTNTTNRRLAVKVLCSNNRVYRVEPVYSFVEPKQAFAAEVHRLDDGQPPKEERLVFAIVEASPTDTNIRELFKGAIPKEVEFKILVDGTQLLVSK